MVGTPKTSTKTVLKDSTVKEDNKSSKTRTMADLIAKADFKIPHPGDNLEGKVLESSRNAVLLDLEPYGIGIVRGRELWEALDSYANLKVGDKVVATVVEQENEDGQIELSFKQASREQAWTDLKERLEKAEIFPVKIKEANRGGLLASINGIPAFLPVSQLASEHYPRVEGGSTDKILTKLQEFIGQEIKVKVITADPTEEKLIISEKEARFEKQRDKMASLKIGDVVEGVVSGVVDFGAFIKFALPSSKETNLEGLVHISELAWQRIDDPSDIVKVGEKIKAEIIGIDGTKISLSIKKLQRDPWLDAVKNYKVGQIVKGKVSEVTSFGAFVQLGKDIHGLVHISEISAKKVSDPREFIKPGEEREFKILSIEPTEHRLGLSIRAVAEKGSKAKRASSTKEKSPKEDSKKESEVSSKKTSKEIVSTEKKSSKEEKKQEKAAEKSTEKTEEKKLKKK